MEATRTGSAPQPTANVVPSKRSLDRWVYRMTCTARPWRTIVAILVNGPGDSVIKPIRIDELHGPLPCLRLEVS